MKNLKISLQIAIGFGAVCLLMLIIVLSVFLSGTNTTNSVSLIDTMNEYVLSVNEVKGTFYNARIYANILLNQNTETAYTRFLDNAKPAADAIKNLSELTKSNDMFENSVNSVNSFASIYDNWFQNLENVKKNYLLIDKIDGLIDYDIMDVTDTLSAMLSDTSLSKEKLSYIAQASVEVQKMMSNAEHVLSGGMVEYAPEVMNQCNEIIDTLSSATDSSNDKMINNLRSFQGSFIEYYDLLNQNAAMSETSIKSGQEAISYLDLILKDADEYMSVIIDYTKDTSRNATNLVGIINTVSIILAIMIAIYLARIITIPIKHVREILTLVAHTGNIHLSDNENQRLHVEAQSKNEVGECAGALISLIDTLQVIDNNLRSIADGDLSMEITQLSEQDSMGIAMRTMIDSLNHTFAEVNGISTEVAENAKGVSDSSFSLAQGATEQTAAVAALGQSIAKVAEKTNESAHMANDAAKLGDTIKINAEKGTHQMDQMMDAVKQINDASNSISKVIGVIDSIAFQTNILALNAAVEAARAGQHGKGFAVVAEEVRNLASKSAEAAKDTGSLIANSMEKAELGAKIAEATSISLAEIVSGINENSRIVKLIAETSTEQTNAIKEINRGISQVGEVVHLISKGAELSSGASLSMKEESNALRGFISSYKLKEGNVNNSQLMLE